MGSYLYSLPLNEYAVGLPHFDSEINESIKNFETKKNRTPNHEEMLKLLNETSNNVNTQYRKKEFSDYQILIEDKKNMRIN